MELDSKLVDNSEEIGFHYWLKIIFTSANIPVSPLPCCSQTGKNDTKARGFHPSREVLAWLLLQGVPVLHSCSPRCFIGMWGSVWIKHELVRKSAPMVQRTVGLWFKVLFSLLCLLIIEIPEQSDCLQIAMLEVKIIRDGLHPVNLI